MPVKTLQPLFLIFSFLFLGQNADAASFIYPPSVKGENRGISKPPNLTVSDFIKLSPREFTTITGKKLNVFQRLNFKLAQHRLSREVKTNPELLSANYDGQKKGKFKFDALWFVVGAILGPIGILFSYTSKQPKNNRKSAFLGFIVFILWFGFLFLF